MEDFDDVADKNLSWLTSDTELFHRMGSRANEALYRMIDAVNRTRDPSNQIRLSEKPIDASDRDTLRILYDTLMKNLGYDRSILTRADIGDFQKKISEALTKRG